MDELTKAEVAATWLFGAEYARSGLSAIDFYACLPQSRRNLVGDMLCAIDRAPDKHPHEPAHV